MNIVFIEEAQNMGGARIATLKSAKLLQKNHNISFIDMWGSSDVFLKKCIENGFEVSVISNKKKPIVFADGRIIKKIFKILGFICYLPFINYKLKHILQTYSPDYICISSKRVFFYLFLSRRYKIVYFQHEWGLHSQMSFISSYLIKHISDEVVCVSNATMQALYNNRVKTLEHLHVYHAYVEEPIIESREREKNCFEILHSAGFTENKGQKISLEIAKKLKQLGFNFHMTMIGIIYENSKSINFYNELLQIIDDYSLKENVEIVVAPKDVNFYVNRCDVLIHPSATEGYGMVIPEAQILKKPVIANPVGGVIDLIIDGFTGFLSEYNDVNSYVSLILRLCDDKNLYDYISRNAYNFAKQTLTKENQLYSLERVFR